MAYHPPLMVVEHVELGNTLKDARDALHRLLGRLPLTTRLGRDTIRTLRAVDRLRCSLDSHLCEHVSPSTDPRRLTTQIYYGEDRIRLRWYDLDELKQDTFAPWTAGE
jgi:hypothetical protein